LLKRCANEGGEQHKVNVLCAHAAGERARLLTARAAGEGTFGENHSPGESRDEGVMKGEGWAVGEGGLLKRMG